MGFLGTRGLTPVKSMSSALTRGLLLAQTASSGPPFTLPSVFAGDRGIAFVQLIKLAIHDKKNFYKQKRNSHKNVEVDRITSLELWKFYVRHRNDPRHVASKFKGLKEKSFRMLARDWLKVYIPVEGFAKMVTNFGAINSILHLAYLLMLNLDEKNAEIWLLQVLKDRVALDVHSYEIVGLNNLRVTYHVPIPIGTSQTQSSSSNIVAFDTTKSFSQTNLVSFKLVIEFPFNTTTFLFDKQKAKVITGYLHDRPLGDDDIDTMKNPGPNNYYWGGCLTTLQSYINTIGKKGMPVLNIPPSFKILNIANDPADKQIEAMYSQGFIYSHNRVPDKNNVDYYLADKESVSLTVAHIAQLIRVYKTRNLRVRDPYKAYEPFRKKINNDFQVWLTNALAKNLI